MRLIKIAKFVLPNVTYTCGHCRSNLKITDVTKNPKHFFNPGQLFSCDCTKSQVWANSVRRMNHLLDYCDGKETYISVEQYGFCNDKFCPKCWEDLAVLKNGQLILDNQKIDNNDLNDFSPEELQNLVNEGRIKSVDIHGCRSCQDNQFLIHQGIEDGEYDGQKTIAIWYKNNQNMWRI
jgi:hypothetical protein